MRRIIATILILLACASIALAKEYFIYDLDGNPVPYEVCDSVIVVKFNPELPVQSALSLSLLYASLRDDTAATLKPHGFYQYVVSAGYEIDSVIAELRQNATIQQVNPTFQAGSAIVYAWNQLLVAFKPELTPDSIQSLLAQYHLSVLSDPGNSNSSWLLEMTAQSPADIFDIGNGLFETGATIYSHPNFSGMIVRSWQPNDAYYQWQWHLNHTDLIYGVVGADIDMEEAWNYAKGDSSIIIAIIDGAFDLDHPDLNQSKIVSPRDVGGHDYINEDTLGDFDPRVPLEADDGSEWFYFFHGTPCLGLISAMTNNYTGISGIGPKFRFMPIKDSDDNFNSDANMTEKCWRWAIDNGADIVSNSNQYTYYVSNIARVTKEAYDSGIAIVNSVGNISAGIQFPANLPWVLGVGATDPYDNIATYSGRGEGIDVMAPSNSVVSLDVRNELGYSAYCESFNDDGYMCDFSGTSASAPQVAAVAALVLSRRPGLICDTCNAEALYEVMRHSSEDQIHPSDVPGYDYLFGWGRLNAARALLAVVRGDADNNGRISVNDVIKIQNYIFGGGPAPQPNVLTGDANGNGSISISDMQYLVRYIFQGGPPPPVSFNY